MPFKRKLSKRTKGLWFGGLLAAAVLVIVVLRDLSYYISEIPPGFEFVDVPSDASALYYAKHEHSFTELKNLMVMRQAEHQARYQLYAFDCVRKSYLTLDEGIKLEHMQPPIAYEDFSSIKANSNEYYLLRYACR